MDQGNITLCVHKEEEDTFHMNKSYFETCKHLIVHVIFLLLFYLPEESSLELYQVHLISLE